MLMPRIQLSIRVKINQANTKEKLRSVLRDAMPEAKVRTTAHEYTVAYVRSINGATKMPLPQPYLLMHVDVRDESIDGIKTWSEKYMGSIKQGFQGFGLELCEKDKQDNAFTIKASDRAIITEDQLL